MADAIDGSDFFEKLMSLEKRWNDFEMDEMRKQEIRKYGTPICACVVVSSTVCIFTSIIISEIIDYIQ